MGGQHHPRGEVIATDDGTNGPGFDVDWRPESGYPAVGKDDRLQHGEQHRERAHDGERASDDPGAALTG